MTVSHARPVIAAGDDLAAAIAAAPAGTTLAIGPGRHVLAAPLVVSRPLALVAAGDATLAFAVGEVALDLAAAGRIELRDLTIVGGVRVRGAATAVLRDVHVIGAPGAGIAFLDDARGEVLAGLIERCGGPGVRVAGRAAPVVEGAILLDNGGPGLAWEDEAAGEAHGNLCEGNVAGILVTGRAAPRLAHNTMRRNACGGVLHLPGATGPRAACRP